MISKIKSGLAIIALSFGLAANSQAQNLELGIRLNPEFTGLLNKNDMNVGKELDYASHFSYLSFGIGAVYNINTNFGVAVDILFSREGEAYKGNLDGSPTDKNAYSSVVVAQGFLNDVPVHGDYVALAELNYVKLPVMLAINTDKSQPVFFTMLVGPQLNFLQGVAMEVNKTDLDFPHTNVKPMDLYKSVTFNGVLAVGVGFNICPKLILSTRLRLDYGFNDVEKKDVMVSYNGGNSERFYSADRQTTTNVSAGLMIGLDFKL